MSEHDGLIPRAAGDTARAAAAPGKTARSYTYELAPARRGVMVAPFVCSTPGCCEALPAPQPEAGSIHSLVMLGRAAKAIDVEATCPRCEGRMFRAPYARAVPR